MQLGGGEDVNALVEKARITWVESVLYKAVVVAEKDMAGATTMINNQIRQFTVGETQIIGQGKLQPSLWKFALGVTKGTKPSRGLVIVEQGFIVEYGVQ